MKRFWIALAVLAVISAWCFVSAALIGSHTDAMLKDLEEVRQAADRADYAAARTAADRAERHWTNCEDLLGALLRHDEADQVMSALAELREYAAVGDRDDLLAVCATTIRQLQHIREMELPLIRNVL